MGRGLSELQRSILRLALHNRTAEGLEPLRYVVTMDVGPFPYTGKGLEPFDVRLARLRDAGFDVLRHRPFHKDAVLRETATRADADTFTARVRACGVDAHTSRDREVGEGGYPRQADVYAWEILASTYGFATGDRHDRLFRSQAPAFDVAEIGPKRYEAARVAIRKAFLRLEGRGFAVVCGGGLELTPSGVTVAEGLSATSPEFSLRSQYARPGPARPARPAVTLPRRTVQGTVSTAPNIHRSHRAGSS
jgi:hypothetical protein